MLPRQEGVEIHDFSANIWFFIMIHICNWKPPRQLSKKSGSKTVLPKKLKIYNTNGPLGKAIHTKTSWRIGICARHRCSSSFSLRTQVAGIRWFSQYHQNTKWISAVYFRDKNRILMTLFYKKKSKWRSGWGYILANFRKMKSSKFGFYRRNTFRKKSKNRHFRGIYQPCI